MLTFYSCDSRGPLPFDLASGIVPPGANWIDAFNATDNEVALLERTFGIALPSLANLQEIESSSRLAVEGETIVMSLPATVRDETGFPSSTPIGFVMSKERVITMRYARLPSFEHLAKRLAEKGGITRGGIGATVTILEIIIDHLADVLERIGGDLDGISRRIFGTDLIASKSHTPRRTNEVMKVQMQTVGRSGDLASKVSESLLGLSRMVPYIATQAESYLSAEHKARLDMVAVDARSLHEYEEHLTAKTQFLLDTLLGIANIEQNNVFRVLTVVSVVGIPPTFFASMWGMNFKTMPELDWAHGYTMGLSVIAISAILPAVWFKVKGWW